MAASYSHTARIDGETLTAAKYNADHQNHIDNMIPGTIDDHSTDLAAMKVTTDPYDSGSASLATDLGGELARLRYMIKQITGQTEWYIDASANLLSIGESRTQNIIINGAMDIWQRGTSFAAAASGIFTVDRFAYIKSGTTTAVHTVSQSTDVPTYAESGFLSQYSLKLDNTTLDGTIGASDYCTIEHRIEGYDYSKFAGNTVTLSFWVKSPITGKHCVSFRNSNSDRSYVVEYTIAVADTWEKHSATVDLDETAGTWDYTNGLGLSVSWVLACGSTLQGVADTWNSANDLATSNQVNVLGNAGDFHLAQVKLELGSTATTFTTAGANAAQELTMCQRYYEKSYNSDIALGTANGAGSVQIVSPVAIADGNYFDRDVTFRVTKRDTPNSATLYSYSVGTENVITVTGSGEVDSGVASLCQSGFAGVLNDSGGTIAALSKARFGWSTDAEL